LINKYINITTWPLQTKISGSAPDNKYHKFQILWYQKDYNYVFSISLLPKQYIRELIQKERKKRRQYIRDKNRDLEAEEIQNCPTEL